jgi:hypothetical protein
MITCNGSELAYGVAPLKPYLRTLIQGLNIPSPEEIPAETPSGHCERSSK